MPERKEFSRYIWWHAPQFRLNLKWCGAKDSTARPTKEARPRHPLLPQGWRAGPQYVSLAFHQAADRGLDMLGIGDIIGGAFSVIRQRPGGCRSGACSTLSR